MRNLVLFFYKNYFTFLFLFLESVAVFLLIQNNNYQRASFVNSSNAVAGSVYETWSGITDYFSLGRSNEQLAKENAELRNMLKGSYTSYLVTPGLVRDSALKQQYSYIVAKVVNNSVNRKNNYLTLNRGSAQGVKKGMAVISGQGVVGIVKEVSSNFSSVMSVLHSKVTVPSSVKKYGETGLLTWETGDYRFGTMRNIPSHLKLLKGDTIVTSSYSSIFPAGIMVGTIEEVQPITGNTFNNLKVRLSTDFGKITYVYIVNNLLKDEQEELEKVSQND
ncbi:MAG: rod shape-determining protein MreC [Bacteroidota bacterium]